MGEFVLKTIDLTKNYKLKTGAAQSYRENAKTFSGELAASLRRFGRQLKPGPAAEFTALDNVNFEVKSGDILGVIGRNGAGKSTLLKIISRVTEPTHGKALVYGRIGSLLEVGTGFHSELTGRENIFVSGSIIGMRQTEIRKKFDEIVAFSGMEKFLELPVKRYSSGMEVRLAFSIAVHLQPELLLVDEVLSIGDANFQRSSLEKIKDLAKAGGAVLFISHNMNSVSALCNQIMVLDYGKVAFQSGDISKGIQFHHDLLLTHSAKIEPSRENISSTQYVSISAFGLRDLYDNPVEQVSSGQPLMLHLEYQVEHPIADKNVFCVFSIQNHKGDLLSLLTSDFPLDMSPTNGAKRSVQCLIDRIPLAPGRIQISAYIERAGQVLDEWVDCYAGEIDPGGRITTISAGVNTGLLALDEKWRYPNQ